MATPKGLYTFDFKTWNDYVAGTMSSESNRELGSKYFGQSDLAYGWNWFGCDTARPVLNNGKSTGTPGTVERPFTYKSWIKNPGDMPEMGLGETHSSSAIGVSASKHIPSLFRNYATLGTRMSVEYHTKMKNAKWYFFGLFEFVNYSEKGPVCPFTVFGFTITLCVGGSGGSENTATVTGKCTQNYGNRAWPSSFVGAWQDKDTLEWFHLPLYHKGRKNAEFKSNDSNHEYHELQNLGYLTQNDHVSGVFIDNKKYCHLVLLPEDYQSSAVKKRLQNAWFRGFAYHMAIPDKDAYHCYTHQFARMLPIFDADPGNGLGGTKPWSSNPNSEYYKNRIVLPIPSIDPTKNWKTQPLKFDYYKYADDHPKYP